MPILAASSGIVIPGCPCTNERASAALVPLPLRRPARPLPAGRPAFLRAAFGAAAVVARARLTDPRGRPGPRRRVAVVAVAVAVPEALEPPTPASAARVFSYSADHRVSLIY